MILKPYKKIFIFRTCPIDRFDNILEEVRKKFTQVKFSVVTREKEAEQIIGKPDVGQVYTYPGDRIGLADIIKISRAIMNEKYDFLLLPYNHIKGRGYWGVDLGSFLIRAKKRYVIFFDNQWQKINFLYLSKKAFLQVTDLILSYLILFVMFFQSVFFRIYNSFLKRENSNVPGKVIFIDHQSVKYPSVRIRCYYFAELLEKRGMKTAIVSFNTDVDKIVSFFDDLLKMKENWHIFRTLVKEKNAVIFLQKAKFHFLGPFLGAFACKNRLIFDVDDWEEGEEHFSKYFAPLCSLAYSFLLRYSDRIITASHYLYEEYKKRSAKVELIPSGVNMEYFPESNNKLREKRKVVISWIGSVSNMLAVENLLFIINILESLNCKDKIKLEILGDGRYLFYIKNKLMNIINVDVEIKDWVDPFKVNDYLQTVDIGVCPLIQDNNFNRSKCPVKLLEYMACSLPVIASDIGEARYIVENGKNGFLATSEEDWRNKLNFLIQDAQLRNTLGNNARKTIEERYDLNLYKDQLYTCVQFNY